MHGIWNARAYHPLFAVYCGFYGCLDGSHEYFYIGFCVEFFMFVCPVTALNAPSRSIPSHNCFCMGVKLIVTLCAQWYLQAGFSSQSLRYRMVPV